MAPRGREGGVELEEERLRRLEEFTVLVSKAGEGMSGKIRRKREEGTGLGGGVLLSWVSS